MHDSAGYSFHGDAPITGLTPNEVNALMLGHHVHNDQHEAAASDEPDNIRQQKRKIERGQRQARREMERDLGFH